MTSKHGMSLSRCQRVLAETMTARAPALSTLQRHAQAGLLKACQVAAGGKLPRYDVDLLRTHYTAWSEVSPHLERQAVATPQAAQLTHQQVEQIARAITGIMAADVAAMAKEVAGLNAVRISLMQKYDAAANLAHDRADLLSKQMAEARKLVDLDMQVARLAAHVAKLSDRLAQSFPEAQ